MSQELKEAFDILSINDKRNQISDELLTIGELIKNLENVNGIPSMLTVKNYDQNKDEEMDENQILTFFYEDIYNIEQELITLLTIINKKN